MESTPRGRAEYSSPGDEERSGGSGHFRWRQRGVALCVAGHPRAEGGLVLPACRVTPPGECDRGPRRRSGQVRTIPMSLSRWLTGRSGDERCHVRVVREAGGEGGRASASNGVRQRLARIAAARPAIRVGGPTVIHGMRWVGLDVARVSAVVVGERDGGLGRGWVDVARDGFGSASGADHRGVDRHGDG